MLNESPNFLQPTHFTTTPGPSARPEYRAVFLFNRQIVLPGLACRAPEQIPAVDLGATTRLVAVFCQQGGYLSTVTGELQGVTGIDDPRLRQLIGQMVPLLFPPIDPTRGRQQHALPDRRGCLSGVRIAVSVVDAPPGGGA